MTKYNSMLPNMLIIIVIIIIIYLTRNGKFPTKRLSMPKSLAVTQLSITGLLESWGLRLTVILIGTWTQEAS